jgi:hypothetical protein
MHFERIVDMYASTKITKVDVSFYTHSLALSLFPCWNRAKQIMQAYRTCAVLATLNEGWKIRNLSCGQIFVSCQIIAAREVEVAMFSNWSGRMQVFVVKFT